MPSVPKLRSYTSPSDAVSVFGKPAKIYHYANGMVNKTNGRIDTSLQGALTFRRGVNKYWQPGYQVSPSVGPLYPSDAADDVSAGLPPGWNPDTDSYSSLVNEARAKFDGKLRYGHADLGVSIGSWRQSWDMIAKRGTQISRVLDRSHNRLKERLNNSQRLEAIRRVREQHRRDARWRGENSYLETPANLVLEGEFGWVPLFQDITKALTVMTQPIPLGRVTGRARGYIDLSDMVDTTYNVQRNSWLGKRKVTIGANVWVDSPNLWLANQLGLLNLPGVAWDLVPWSFVVNMFSNAGQIANSFTSHYGLRMMNASTTKSCLVIHDRTISPKGSDSRIAPARSVNWLTHRKRIVGAIPSPTFEFKMPEVNLELAIIGLSLAVQQVSRITRLLR